MSLLPRVLSRHLGYLILTSLLFAAGTASAQCAGNLCAPVVSGVNGAPRSIDVHWLPGGGVPPQRVALVKGGSAAKSFADGQTLASATALSNLGAYANYDLSVGNLAPGTSYPLGALRVVGFWGGQSIASAAFGAATQAGDGGNGPTITQSFFDPYGQISLQWTATNSTYYNVRWSSGTAVAANANQGEDKGTSWLWRPDGTGPYTFAVQGCDREPLTGQSTECTHWSQPVTVNVTPLPPPRVTTLTFPHLTSGDCELDGASVQFRSNGTGAFSARVKTDHTHSGDTWHATLSGLNTANQSVVSLPTFDSTRMDDDHGYYPWNVNFTFDPTKWSQIVNVDMHKSC